MVSNSRVELGPPVERLSVFIQFSNAYADSLLLPSLLLLLSGEPDPLLRPLWLMRVPV